MPNARARAAADETSRPKNETTPPRAAPMVEPEGEAQGGARAPQHLSAATAQGASPQKKSPSGTPVVTFRLDHLFKGGHFVGCNNSVWPRRSIRLLSLYIPYHYNVHQVHLLYFHNTHLIGTWLQALLQYSQYSRSFCPSLWYRHRLHISFFISTFLIRSICNTICRINLGGQVPSNNLAQICTHIPHILRTFLYPCGKYYPFRIYHMQIPQLDI